MRETENKKELLYVSSKVVSPITCLVLIDLYPNQQSVIVYAVQFHSGDSKPVCLPYCLTEGCRL